MSPLAEATITGIVTVDDWHVMPSRGCRERLGFKLERL